MAGEAAAHFAVGRIWRKTTRVAGGRAVDAVQLPKKAFDAPEAAHRKNGDVHVVRHVGHRMAVNRVKCRDRHRGSAARQRFFFANCLCFIGELNHGKTPLILFNQVCWLYLQLTLHTIAPYAHRIIATISIDILPG
jgi:hypothetical protein